MFHVPCVSIGTKASFRTYGALVANSSVSCRASKVCASWPRFLRQTSSLSRWQALSVLRRPMPRWTAGKDVALASKEVLVAAGEPTCGWRASAKTSCRKG